MSYYLIVYTQYKDTYLALFKDDNCLEYKIEDNKLLSKNFINNLEFILEKNKLSIKDISFIGAYLGPAPFTTLRVSLSFVNGLSYGSSIPLVGIDGLEVFLQEHKNPDYSYTIAILNAFADEVYYGILDNSSGKIETGYTSISNFKNNFINKPATYFDELSMSGAKKTKFIGNGCGFFPEIPAPCPDLPSLPAVAADALRQYNNKATKTQLLPMYLKSTNYVMVK